MRLLIPMNGKKIVAAVLMGLFLMLPVGVLGADRLYFVPLVEKNVRTDAPKILLEWGPLEGGIPAEVLEFRLYRSVNGSAYSLVPNGRIVYDLASASEIRAIVLADDSDARIKELLISLNNISQGQDPPGPVINSNNFHAFLHDLLDPVLPGHDPLQRLLLTRSFPAVAQSTGLAYMDTDVSLGRTYRYLLTAYTAGGTETLPIGQTEDIDPAIETVLPAPTGLKQIRIFGCSELRKSLDDNRIHFTWDIPSRPNEIGLQVMTYGYDLFWSATDIGPVNFREKIPAELTKVNAVPILVSGPPPDEGPDSFLARDDGRTHTSGPPWERGQQYFYYIAARDLAGHYSGLIWAIPGKVVDATPPKIPWDVHTEEIKDPADGVTPRLALVWDQANSVNFVRYYGTGKNICSTADDQVCYTIGEESCADETKIRCADVEVDRYHIFRFDSPEAASMWGNDTDGDLWHDQLEKDSGTDPCDDASHPAGTPAQYVTTIGQNNTAYQRDLGSDHVQMAFVDYAIVPDNKVFWYRIVAVDRDDNQSPLSPPARAVLYDRTQPVPTGKLEIEDCSYNAFFKTPCEENPDKDDVLILVDRTKGDAAFYGLYLVCIDPKTKRPYYRRLLYNPMRSTVERIKRDMLEKIYGCQIPDCSGRGLVVRFYRGDGRVLAESDPFMMESFCSYGGCVYLEKECRWEPADPGEVPDGSIRTCVELKTGESARIYHLVGGQMSPFSSIAPVPVDDEYCFNIDDLEGIVPADLCLGIRVFSPNHVGSGMYYFNCLELTAYGGALPPAPLIDGIDPKKDGSGDPAFEVRWTSPAAGMAAFVINWEHQNDVRYEVVWGATPDEAGQYAHLLSLNPSDVNKKWCFQIRAIDTIMQRSPWSAEMCAVWEEGEAENLAWPRVAEPGTGQDLTAFFLREPSTDSPVGLPVIVLSDNLTAQLQQLGQCDARVAICDGKEKICLADSPQQYDRGCHQICEVMRAALIAGNFIVYRQDQGRDFVQVSPLIEGFHCTTESFGGEEIIATLHDPFIFLRNFTSNAIGGGVDPALAQGIRIVFQDRYPHLAGAKIRYKMMAIDRVSGEMVAEHTTNWVDIP